LPLEVRGPSINAVYEGFLAQPPLQEKLDAINRYSDEIIANFN
jgi:hypothetical protein